MSNEEALKRTSLPSIESILLQVQLRWAGHVIRMEDIRMSKAVFFSKLQKEKCDCGAPRKRYKDQLKRQLAQARISNQSWQQVASDWDSWHSSVKKASCGFEPERHKATKGKCRRQKEWAASLPSSSQTFVCPNGCASRIGLYSHQQACKNWLSTFRMILVWEEWEIITKLLQKYFYWTFWISRPHPDHHFKELPFNYLVYYMETKMTDPYMFYQHVCTKAYRVLKSLAQAAL